jgi:AraC-like DNA-binding protein
MEHYLVAKYYTVAEHTRVPDVQIASQRTWEILPEEYRTIIQECAQESALYQRNLWVRNDIFARATVIDSGCEIIHLEPGFRILIPPHTPFSTRNSEKFNQYYIHFSLESSSRNNYFSVHRRPIIMPADDPETFFAGLRKKDISSREILLTAYMQTADALMNIPSQYMLAPNEVPMDPRISAALKFMQNSSGATPTNGEIARKAGMSENNFLRLFRLELKDSPRQYMLRLHLHRCLDMLKDPSLSLDDVAQAGGFADRYHFSKAFSKVFGTSPGRYRRLARENAASDQ